MRQALIIPQGFRFAKSEASVRRDLHGNRHGNSKSSRREGKVDFDSSAQCHPPPPSPQTIRLDCRPSSPASESRCKPLSHQSHHNSLPPSSFGRQLRTFPNALRTRHFRNVFRPQPRYGTASLKREQCSNTPQALPSHHPPSITSAFPPRNPQHDPPRKTGGGAGGTKLCGVPGEERRGTGVDPDSISSSI